MDPVRGLIHLSLKVTESTLDRALGIVRLADTLLVSTAVPPVRERDSGTSPWPDEEQADLDALSATLRARAAAGQPSDRSGSEQVSTAGSAPAASTAAKKASVKRPPAKKASAKKASVKRPSAKAASATKTSAKKATGKKAAAVKRAPAKRATVTKTTPAKRATVTKASAKKAAAAPTLVVLPDA